MPNSFVYRYVAKKPGDLANGKLQVLQVLNASNEPITQATQTALQSPDQLALHTYGSVFDTKWITIHDTAVNGNTPFNANVAAKAANGTPFKRPENGAFRPDGKFAEFYFDETGDTERDQSRERLLRRLDRRCFKLRRPTRRRTRASCGSSTRATRRTPASTTSHS